MEAPAGYSLGRRPRLQLNEDGAESAASKLRHAALATGSMIGKRPRARLWAQSQRALDRFARNAPTRDKLSLWICEFSGSSSEDQPQR